MKTVFTMVIWAALLALGSCSGGQQKVPFEELDEMDINRDTTIYGFCGDGTSMNSLQLITDNGDTLVLGLLRAHDSGRVLGGFGVGDRMAVLVNNDSTAAKLVINQTALLGDWVMPNPIDGSSEIGISLRVGGIAESIDQSSIVYKTWKLFNGYLEIVSDRDGGIGMEETNRYEIVRLTADSLVYKDTEDTFEYGRQIIEQEEDLGIELDDGSADEFRM